MHRPRRHHHCTSLLWVCLAAMLALGLARAPGAQTAAGPSASAPAPAWPPPPADPRVVYLNSITSPADLGIKPKALTRFANWISGGGNSSSRLDKPFGLALDEAGNLLFTDTGAGSVGCLDRAGKKWLHWEQAGKIRFVSPVAVARHRETVFVADSTLGKVLAFDLKGKLRFEITRELERPAGLVIHADKLFVADSHLHQVVVCNLRGEFLSKFGRRGSAPGEFNFPTHLAAAAGGRLFVTDSMNCRVQVFAPAGQFQFAIGSPGDSPGNLSRPKGVAVDRLGHIYVVDALFDNVQIFDEQSRLLLNWGEAGSAPGQFWLPNGIAIGMDDRIYIADSYNHRIQVFKFTGKS